MASSDRDVVAELAPSGTLRAAINLGNVVLAKDDPQHGPTGVTVDLARDLARTLDIPLQLIAYPTAGAVIPGLTQDRWDVAFLAAEPERAAQITFTAPYVFIDATYLVRRDGVFRATPDLDVPGVRIAVGKGTAYDLALTRILKFATLVRTPSSAAAIELFMQEGLDAAGGIRQALVDASASGPEYLVLPDSFSRIEQGMAVPQGRDLAAAYVGEFLEARKLSGFIRQALDRHGQHSATIAGIPEDRDPAG